MTEEAASWAVDTWALALGAAPPTHIPSPPAPFATPKHMSQVSPARHNPTAPSSPTYMQPDHRHLTITSPIPIELIRIPAGDFLMGSDPTRDPDALENEQPQRTVTLSEYYIGKHPITNHQYAGYLARDPKALAASPFVLYNLPAGHPANFVSFHNAMAFVRWLSEATGLKVGLPKEAEWERAARGTGGNTYPWGDSPPTEALCNFANNVSGDPRTTPVGFYSPQGDSPDGCADMAGNVMEWTLGLADRVWRNHGWRNQGYRILRGGSYAAPQQYVRSSCRSSSDDPKRQNGLFGFRIVVRPPLAS